MRGIRLWSEQFSVNKKEKTFKTRGILPASIICHKRSKALKGGHRKHELKEELYEIKAFGSVNPRLRYKTSITKTYTS